MHNKAGSGITILTSLVGYGAFIPALLLYNHLVGCGCRVSLEVIEQFYSSGTQKVFEDTRAAFRKNVKLVKIASALSAQLEKNTDKNLLQPLFQSWQKQGNTKFVCFSGLWCETMAGYLQQEYAAQSQVIFCKVDSGFSSAWKNSHPELAEHRFTSFFDAAAGKVQFKIMPPGIIPAPFSQRKNNLLLHGGGWSLGNFRQAAETIPAALYSKYIVHLADDITPGQTGNAEIVKATHKWNPLHCREDFFRFPSYYTLSEPQNIHFGLWQLINQGKAIISKPGGMTLMDSLVTATPLVMLEPAGKNEEDNAMLWQQLGFGIHYKDWEAVGFDESMLLQMHSKLLKQYHQSEDFYTFIEQQLLK